MVTLGLDLQQAGDLHGGTQEDGIQYFFPGVLRKLPSLGQSTHQIREAEHLVEISLEPVPVPAQLWRSSFSLRNRFRLTPQIVAAAVSKRRRISIFSRTFSTKCAGMSRAFGLPSINTEIFEKKVQLSPTGRNFHRAQQRKDEAKSRTGRSHQA